MSSPRLLLIPVPVGAIRFGALFNFTFLDSSSDNTNFSIWETVPKLLHLLCQFPHKSELILKSSLDFQECREKIGQPGVWTRKGERDIVNL